MSPIKFESQSRLIISGAHPDVKAELYDAGKYAGGPGSEPEEPSSPKDPASPEEPARFRVIVIFVPDKLKDAVLEEEKAIYYEGPVEGGRPVKTEVFYQRSRVDVDGSIARLILEGPYPHAEHPHT